MTAPIVFLIDNGSLRPHATLQLRALARQLSARVGLEVEAVSLLHSHKIPADQLNGEPARIVKRRLRELGEAGAHHIVCLPLFLGPSLAIAEYLPQLIEEARTEHPDLKVEIAPVLSGAQVDAPDGRLIRILADYVRALGPDPETRVALVDHGTPIEPVNRVRNAAARLLASELAGEVASVQPCSMERREGKAYAFNDPLLENLGECPALAGGRLILAMFFLLPGKHAGEGGDVADICDGLCQAGSFTRIDRTPLLGESPRLLDLLEDRLRAML